MSISKDACESVITWNIEGLTSVNKSAEDFQNLIYKYDIIVLSETWTNRLSNVDLSGFQDIHSFRKYQPCRTKRSSGGIVIFLRNEISKCVKVVLNQINCLIWLEIDKNYFNIEQDLYLGCVYIAPESSPVHHMYDIDIFRQI